MEHKLVSGRRGHVSAVASMAILGVAVMSVPACRKGALIQLGEQGWQISGSGPALTLSFNGEPPPNSTVLLARLRGPFTIHLSRANGRIPEWGTVPNLIGVSISDPKLVNLSPLKNLAALSKLDLSGTATTDLSPLRDLVNVRHLDLADTQVRDLSPLANLHNLEWLSLSGTKVRDISPLKGLTRIKKLNLKATGITDLTLVKNRRGLSIVQ